MFDNISKDELIMAFFPCIRFEDQIMMCFRGDHWSQRGWDVSRKLKYAIKLQEELTDLYTLLSQLVLICIEKEIPLIIENPWSPQHYLVQRWCMKPGVVDKDRRERGDKYKKPTQYWFVNCEPTYNFIFEPQIMWDEYLTVEKQNVVERSLMTKEYANRFIREFIL